MTRCWSLAPDGWRRAKRPSARRLSGSPHTLQHSIVPAQGNMVMLEAGDTVLVLSQTLLDADTGGFCLQHGAACDLCLPPDRSEMAVRHRQFVRHFIAG